MGNTVPYRGEVSSKDGTRMDFCRCRGTSDFRATISMSSPGQSYGAEPKDRVGTTRVIAYLEIQSHLILPHPSAEKFKYIQRRKLHFECAMIKDHKHSRRF